MSVLRNLFAASTLVAAAWSSAAGAGDPTYGLGTVPTAEEIAAWDIDVRPDGQGLPAGSGTAESGEEVFIEKCGACHGEFGEAVGRFPVLMGGQGSLTSENPVKTAGSYWPYASALWDYIYRAMPFGEAQTLSYDETYAIVAYLLYINYVVEEDFVLDQTSLATVEMPNAAGFIDDDRLSEPSHGAEPCMRDCKTDVKIFNKARRLDVTPTEDDS